MGAHPFGGHPTLARYIAWARTEGCEAQSGLIQDPDGGMVEYTKITAPNGKWVIEVGTTANERLAPTTVGRLDRRLGLKSPFASMP